MFGWFKKSLEESKGIQRRPLRQFKNFPLSEDGQSYLINKELMLSFYQLQNRFRVDMWGGFTHDELALMAMDELLNLGWKAPEN